MKKHIIYKRTFPNGKVYIGQTGQPIDRYIKAITSFAFNKNNKNYDCFYYRAIRKYTDKGIGTEILYSNIDSDCIDDLETLMISTYDAINHLFGYNTCPVGQHVMSGRKHSEETKIKLSLFLKGRPSPKKGIKTGKPSWNKGKSMSEQLKKHLSKINLGKVYKQIPTVAQDQNGVFQLVYPHRFFNYKKSPWHRCCSRLYRKINEVGIK